MTTVKDDRLPFHVLVPADPGSPIDAYEQSAALQLAILDRTSVKALTTDWDAPGVYILLDRHASDGTWGAYVGKAPAGIRARIKNHLTNKDHWYRAILVKRDTTHGFNSAHTAWFEGRLYDLLESATEARLHNAQRPGDDTLASYDLPMLESSVEPVARLLRLMGHDPSTATEQEAVVVKGHKIFHGVTLSNLIEAGLLRGNEVLTSTWSTVTATAKLQPDGQVEYDGVKYGSLSSAAAAARGGAANGWSMWAITTLTGKVRLSTLRTRFLEAK
jgi:hypothetical protein